jgi:hypothetical protein
MKQKLLTLFALLLGVCSGAWAADEVIFKWQYDGTSTYGDGNNNGEFAITNTSGIGTVKFVTYEKKKTSAEGTIGYNASVTDNDLKPSISNGCKLGNNGAHIKISPASGNFKAGDIIYVCAYNPVIISTGKAEPASTADVNAEGVLSGNEGLTTGSAKGSYAVGQLILPNNFEEKGAIYISRVSSSVGIAAIKVVRPDQSKTASDLTLTSSSSVTLNPEETSLITYTTSSNGAVTYTTSASGVATVSSTGLITAVAYGTATITINQAADATYNAGSKTVTVNVNKVRKATTVTGEFVLDTNNGSQSNKVYTSNDGSVLIEAGSTGAGSDTYFDLKDSHFKVSGDCLFTLPTNYPVSTVWFVGYSNSDADRAITLKEVDGVAVTEQSGTILKRNQIPATDCVGFELETPATESIKINVANECRGYFILNPAAKNITMTQVGTNYYASYYSAGEVTITGATAYTAELDAVNNKLVLTECTGGVVGGRTGVILIGNSASATATPSFTGATKEQGDLIGVAQKEVAMANYYAGSTSAADKVFVLGKEDDKAGLYKYTGTSLGVNKAYLYNETLASARSIDFVFGDETTTIKGISTEKVKAELKKFFENGKLVIENNGVKYNVAGQQEK